MICRFCGAELPENATICSACGKLLPEDVLTQQPASVQGETVCIRFLDEDGHVLQSTTYRVGARILAPKPKDFFYLDGVSYYFNGWNPAPPTIAETSADFQACYSPNSMQPVKPVLDREQPEPEKKQATPPPPPIICEYPALPRSSQKRLYAIVAACLALCLVLGVGFAIWKPWANPADNGSSESVLSGVNTDPPAEPFPSDSGDNGGNTSPDGGETSGTPETPEEPVTPPEWSDWEDTLPTSVTEDRYDIETRTVYRSSALEYQDSTTTDSMDGWELYDTKKEDGGWGKWSGWDTTKVSESSTRQVQQKTQYRYADKETTTSESETLEGWTYESVDKAEYTHGAWSQWKPLNDLSDEERQEIDSKVENDLIEREDKSCQRHMTIYWATNTQSDWSDWDPDDQTPATDSVLVETELCIRYRDKYLSQPAIYHFYHQSDWSKWSDTRESATDTHIEDSQALYCYRNKQPSTTTYYFRRWGDWSDWSDQQIEASDELKVESKLQYHYRAKS